MEGLALKAENILAAMGSYKSRLHFFYCVYIAQKLGILPEIYSFDFGMNIPVCSKLESETMALFGSEKILPHNGQGTYRLNHSKLKQECTSLSPGQVNALQELNSYQTEDLIKIALVLHSLPGSISGVSDKEIKKRIENELMIKPEETDRIYNIFQKLKFFLAAKQLEKQLEF